MDQGLLVQILDGAAYLEEQFELLSQGKPLAVAIDRLTFDILHREVWLTVFQMSRIEEMRDIRVGERSQDVPLAEEALAMGVGPTGVQEFHGRALVISPSSRSAK